jgi:2'-5' RNA ligase
MSSAEPGSVISEDLERFRNIQWLHNHWSRSASQRAYYWYLTFEHCPDLHSLARHCQGAIDFPYYDLTPPRDLHLTLDRIGLYEDIPAGILVNITAAAVRVCQQTPAFDITIGPLGGTPGAIGFSVSPGERLASLRDKLRAATLSVYPQAPVSPSEFHAHVTIAYANSDGVPATDVVAAVERLNATSRRSDVTVNVTNGTLVLLEQQPHSYAWEAVSRIPLVG